MAKFDNVVIVSDMDGTFFGKGSRIVPENVEAIEYFNKNGGRFTFITGRNYVSVVHGHPELLGCISAPVAFHNGAVIYDIKQDKALFEKSLAPSLVCDLYPFLMSFYPEINSTLRCPFGFYSIYAEQFGKAFSSYEKFCHTTTYEELSSLSVNKIVFSGNVEKFPEMRRLVLEKYGDAVQCTSAGAGSVELMPYGINKGSAVRTLRTLPGFSDARIFAIGDYENDLEMLSEADVSACPENAHADVKKICDLQVCHHDEGAVAQLIKTIEEKYLG